jgi:hypothetical protein
VARRDDAGTAGARQPLVDALGLFGFDGCTAYFGLRRTAAPKPGETSGISVFADVFDETAARPLIRLRRTPASPR